MESAQVTQIIARRRRLWPVPDFGAFFMFFGISGTDWNQEERLHQRFEREYYRQLVALRLAGSTPPGRYHLRGLPAEASRRGWTLTANGTASATLSDEGLGELKEWMARADRSILLDPLS